MSLKVVTYLRYEIELQGFENKAAKKSFGPEYNEVNNIGMSHKMKIETNTEYLVLFCWHSETEETPMGWECS